MQIENITPLCPLGLMAISNHFAANKAVLQQFMDAWKESNALAVSSNADSNAGLKQYVKITDLAQLNGSWQAYKGVWEAAAYPVSAMRQMLDQLAHSNPLVTRAATADPASLIDNTFINQAS